MPGPPVQPQGKPSPTVPGWQCHRAEGFCATNHLQRGTWCDFHHFFLFFLNSSFHQNEANWFLAGPAMCVAGRRAREGFPPSLSIFETGMGGEEGAGSSRAGGVSTGSYFRAAVRRGKPGPVLTVFPCQTPNLPTQPHAGFRHGAARSRSDSARCRVLVHSPVFLVAG